MNKKGIVVIIIGIAILIGIVSVVSYANILNETEIGQDSTNTALNTTGKRIVIQLEESLSATSP